MEDLSREKDISPLSPKEDESFDSALRPKTWDDFIGQEKTKKNLQVMLKAAKKRGESCPEHLLFYGNSGLGKTSLSYLISREMESNIRTITGPAIKKVGDLAAILTNLEEGDLLFCDEVHRMNKMIEEFLYPALEDFKLSLILGKGPMARTMDLKLPKFTFIGATTRVASVSAPLRNRFGATFQLNFYTQEEIESIIKNSSKLLDVEIEPEAIKLIAERARFTPRVANRLLKRVRDFAQVEGEDIIDEKTAEKAMKFLEIDKAGLEPGDRKIIKTIVKKFSGGPVGLQTLAAATAEEEDTILDIYEPYLMRMGFLAKTPRGRVATKEAYRHLELKYKGGQEYLI